MKLVILTAVCISFFTFVGFSQTGLQVGKSAPTFSATALDGTHYDLSELRGSVVVLTFWSTKCYICQQEFPKLNEVVLRYQGRVVFLSLTVENETTVESFLRSNKVASVVVPNSFEVLLQYADRDKRGYLDIGFPSYFVIDQQGILQHRSSGWNKTGALDATISSLLR